MKKIIFFVFIAFIIGCTNKNTVESDKRIMLRTDTVNAITMKDTMVIYESVCRGCAYEQSTKFSIEDTAGIVELDHIDTHDNSSSDEEGGSIGKTLVIIPKKTGSTNIKAYKFWNEPFTAEDSSHYTTYNIEVKN